MNKRVQAITIISVLCIFLGAVTMGIDGCKPKATGPTEDGSTWEAASEPGFGINDNYAVVAMAAYKGYLYAMARNEVDGAEIWRTDGTTWEQVLFPDGETNGLYGNPWVNALWGSLIVFNDKLYCGFSSGYQGTVLVSTGCEVWRYDGSVWEPVISDRKDVDESGEISDISGCQNEDGDVTAQITDSTKSWEENQWAGGTLQITSGDGKFRRFDIITNTDNTLTIQQNEVAGNIEAEYTICEGQHFENPFPPYEYDVGPVVAGDSYEIGMGSDENGFGIYWNKMVTEMVIFEGRLFVSTGLNYDYGAQVWYTDDGDNWTVTTPEHSFGNYHNDPGYKDGQKPVSTSIPSLCVSAVSGEPVLYAGGTGASGDQGRCSRVAKLTDDGWELIVDVHVDDNDEGTNENGFGGGMDCSMWNGDFMPWSMADFNDMLHVGIQSLAGTRVLYTDTGSSQDGAWFHSVGGDSDMPNGFDGKRNRGFPLAYQNISANLFVFNNAMFAGLVSIYSPPLRANQKYLTGAQLWKTPDGLSWQPVTLNGFGDEHIISFESFAEFNGSLYIGANKGSVDGPEGLHPPEGGMVYKMVSSPETPAPRFEETENYETTIPRYDGDPADPADIYYPLANDNQTRTFPLALLLQGGRIDKKYYSTFARTVARYGFIVVVPNHMNVFSVPGVEAEDLFAEAQQMYDTLEFMAAENTNPESPIAGIIDTQTLVMLGHSYGSAVTIGAIQNVCEYPLCEGGEFTRPEELKAVALCGINTRPHGDPTSPRIRDTHNRGMPIAFINGKLDSNASYVESIRSFNKIEDPPKLLIFIDGANHYAMSNENNPPGPGPDNAEPTLDQQVSIETSARWSALFLRAHALNDEAAHEYVHETGLYLDQNVEVYSEPE